MAQNTERRRTGFSNDQSSPYTRQESTSELLADHKVRQKGKTISKQN